MKLSPMNFDNAIDWLNQRHCRMNVTHQDEGFAICLTEKMLEPDDMELIHGVIVMIANGEECKLGHLYTDGGELVGSILYGGAWRAAKALGYKTITI